MLKYKITSPKPQSHSQSFGEVMGILNVNEAT